MNTDLSFKQFMWKGKNKKEELKTGFLFFVFKKF